MCIRDRRPEGPFAAKPLKSASRIDQCRGCDAAHPDRTAWPRAKAERKGRRPCKRAMRERNR
eukprot:9640092-Alexandrium_andersonii.AAC.1